jgi:hypothetical protein
MRKHTKIIVLQLLFLIGIVSFIYFSYPKAEVGVSGNFISLDSKNAEYIAIAKNPDFSDAKYIDLSETKKLGFELEPGNYYVRAGNWVIAGFSSEIEVNSTVALTIENDSLVNVGNVKLKVTKGKNGAMVGNIVLEPTDSQNINSQEDTVYKGEQNGI